ncbi:MAG: type III-A CRISPR-associated RAMP protein Csm4 [bacterium]
MEDITAYKLEFKTPLHLGQEGIGLEKTDMIIHSDTLFSALLSCWNLFYADDLEKEIINNPPFIISSAFPFSKDDYFLPRPMIRITLNQEVQSKQIKKIRFISKGLFERIIIGEEVLFTEENTLQGGLFWTETQDTSQGIFKKREVPRVSIDRRTNTSDIFYFNELVFTQGCGLFFLVKFLSPQIRQKFETVLNLMGDEGIGGDKHLGKGVFDVLKDEPFKLNTPSQANHFLTLSLFHPTEDEIKKGLLNNSSYELILRRGWLHSKGAMSLKRKSIRMFLEGSVFKEFGQKGYGNIPNVLEKNEELGTNHNVYRYGITFNIPIKVRDNYE